MEALIHVIETYGLWVVFISVLLDQSGLPTPSYAPMIVTAALATDAGEPLWPILLVGAVAALVADVAWFAGGRRYGARLLRLMCRISSDELRAEMQSIPGLMLGRRAQCGKPRPQRVDRRQRQRERRLRAQDRSGQRHRRLLRLPQ